MLLVSTIYLDGVPLLETDAFRGRDPGAIQAFLLREDVATLNPETQVRRLAWSYKIRLPDATHIAIEGPVVQGPPDLPAARRSGDPRYFPETDVTTLRHEVQHLRALLRLYLTREEAASCSDSTPSATTR